MKDTRLSPEARALLASLVHDIFTVYEVLPQLSNHHAYDSAWQDMRRMKRAQQVLLDTGDTDLALAELSAD